MYIKKLIIDEYGPFKKQEFSLEEGLNIVEGNNESGKSTILSFIRFMLYGMPRKSAGNISDRDRGISWSGGVAGGSMELSVRDRHGEVREYRIERHGQLRGSTGHENYAEAVKIIDLATGSEVFEGQEPGRAMLGLSQETYVSTACLRQLECANVDGTGVNASIENLLFAANEGINTEKATAKLDEVRKTLLHKNGKGGEIAELEELKAQLEEKLTHAKEAAEAIVTKESATEALGILENEIAAKIRGCESVTALYENCTVLRRFDELHQKEEELAAQTEALRMLEEQKGYAGPLPDRSAVANTEALIRELSDAATAHAMAEAEVAKAKNAADGDRTLAAHAETVETEGGRETVEARFDSLGKKQVRAHLGFVASLSAGLALLVVGLLGLVLGLSFESPLFGMTFLSGVADAVEASLLPHLGGSAVVWIILSALLLAGGIGLTVLSGFCAASSKEAQRLRTSLAEKLALTATDADAKALAAHMDACVENRLRCEAYDTALSRANTHATRCREALEAQIGQCHGALAAFDISCDEQSPDALARILRETVDTLMALCLEKERIESELRRLRAVVDTMAGALAEYNENALRSAVGQKDPAEVVETTDIEKVETMHRYFKEQLSAATSKRIGLEKELIALTAASENPAKLSAKLEETVAALDEKRFRHEALMMAMEAIETASDGLRRSVTPRIREKAGAFMGCITDGKYGELGVAPDMSVSIFAGNSTRSIDVLSKGTKDAAYLSLRMALADLVSPHDPLTLTMDEGLSLLDETRAKKMLALLHAYTQNGGQCILFTCHKREGELMRDIGQFHHIVLSPSAQS